ncbi:MAG: ABC transporter ATP-binding protein [Deltaproteobacteria bacterium]|nr:ABC transporter ATP-binding protein [Deltaproteobacteria bacterium]MBT4641731.1 ABC transporter ATP-binding protein [Deltaproteobacteria bacterium]MBT6504628.1 ABC transporter ATP-binding protein [Deltaproteobacteria bacterium]MBT7151545.1 ABC transporter ATP-binding protein [Deltaproteobacteria bacterium]MBT7713656.1 ABC transporter ATP-binding protein [Deltaproteobacteria bacterium]
MTKLLEIKNIETYYDLIFAIRGASLSIEEGSITAILGNNGAGKSTILKTMMGLLDDQPDKGTIEFMGQRIDGRDTEDIVRLGIAYVPEGREVFEELTVRENLLMGAYLRRDRAGISQDMERVFQYFPILKDRTSQWAGTLSGGEQQMLAIGRALMNRPKLMCLDEPSLGLSPILVKEIFKIIKTINQEGVTILLVEQNARMALSNSDFGFILENGRFMMKDRSSDLLQDENVKEFYMGVRSEESAKGYQRWKRKKVWR